MEGLQGPKAEGNELDPVQAAAQPRVNRMPMGSALLVVLSHEDGDQQRKPCVAMPRREPETADADGCRSKEHAGAPIYVYTRGSCRRVIILSYTARGCDQPFHKTFIIRNPISQKSRAEYSRRLPHSAVWSGLQSPSRPSFCRSASRLGPERGQSEKAPPPVRPAPARRASSS